MMRRDEVEVELGLQPNSDTIIGVIPPAPEAFQQAAQMGIPVIINKPHILAARALIEVANKISLYTHEI